MMLSPMISAPASKASSTSTGRRCRGCCCCGRKKFELERRRTGVSEGCRRALSRPAAARAGLGEGRGGWGGESGRRKPTRVLRELLLLLVLRRLLLLLLSRRRRQAFVAVGAAAVTAAAAAVRDGAQAQRRSTRATRRGLGRTLVVPTAEGMVGGPRLACLGMCGGLGVSRPGGAVGKWKERQHAYAFAGDAGGGLCTFE